MVEYKYDLISGRYNESVAGESIRDTSNWITVGKTQSAFDLEVEKMIINHNDIIRDDGSGLPF